jgi:predicted aspartyl protease
MTFELLSRRRFAGAALASLPLMASALRAQSAPALVDPAPIPTATDSSQHLTIAVEINGRGPFRFVVDTGADRSVLADTTVEALALRPIGAVNLAGIVRTVRAETVDVASLSFGAMNRRNLNLPVLPRSQLAADGYLGLDMLDGNRVILDFAEQQLTVTDPLPVVLSVYHSPYLIVLHSQGSDGHLRTTSCSIDRIPVRAFIDTGAESSMGNEALYRALVASDSSHASTQTVALTGLTGGTAIGRLIFPREVKIGRASATDCPIAIADLQVFDIWGLNDRPALLIGMNWLRHFKRVEIDYGRKDLRFEIGSAHFAITA